MALDHSAKQFHIILNLYFTLSVVRVSLGLNEVKFYAGVLCDLQQRTNNNCSTLMTNINKLAKCVFECNRDPECVGASMTYDHRRCFHHYACMQITECSTKEDRHNYKSKKCAHGGEWSPRSSTCSCVGGWIGKNCLDLPSECPDLKKHGYQSSRTYLAIRTAGDTDPIRPPILAFCEISQSNSWTAVQVAVNFGKTDFNRTWEEYRKGFYESKQNFWLGLESWHALSSTGYTTLTISMNIGNTFRRYTNFHVGNELQAFSFTFETTMMYTRSKPDVNFFDDCLGALQNTSFSTKDKNDDDTENCALKVGSGWWHDHDNCTASPCNFLGKAPRDWDGIPVYQRMRVGGVSPDLIKQYDPNIGAKFQLNKSKGGAN